MSFNDVSTQRILVVTLYADLLIMPTWPVKSQLTVRMVARIQGFPDDWEITGRKTAAYRQVGNAFPPPVAQAFGIAIANALKVTSGVTTSAVTRKN